MYGQNRSQISVIINRGFCDDKFLSKQINIAKRKTNNIFLEYCVAQEILKNAETILNLDILTRLQKYRKIKEKQSNCLLYSSLHNRQNFEIHCNSRVRYPSIEEHPKVSET